MEKEIRCPKCQSDQWRCWDERVEWFKDDDGEPFEYPVGYLVCRDCGHEYTHTWTVAEYLGKDIDEAYDSLEGEQGEQAIEDEGIGGGR